MNGCLLSYKLLVQAGHGSIASKPPISNACRSDPALRTLGFFGLSISAQSIATIRSHIGPTLNNLDHLVLSLASRLRQSLAAIAQHLTS